MLRPAALALLMCFGGFAASFAANGQTPPAPSPQPAPTPAPAPAPTPTPAPATPPAAPVAPTAPAPPPPPVEPVAPVAPIPRGDFESEVGPAGPPTNVPELMARTPDVACVSSLLGAEILDLGSESVARLDELVARQDGQVVAIVALPDGRRVGVPLVEMIARAKPDPVGESESGTETGSESVTIRSFKLARVSRRIEAAPEVGDASRLGAEWLATLDAGTPGVEHDAAPAVADTDPATSGEPGSGKPGSGKPGSGEAASGEARSGEASSGEARPPQPDAAPLPRLGALLGRAALDPAGQPIGTVVDVVIDVPAARVAYLVVRRPKGTDAPDVFRAMPLQSLARSGDEESVRLTIGARELAASPPIHGLTSLPVDPFAAAGAATAPPR